MRDHLADASEMVTPPEREPVMTLIDQMAKAVYETYVAGYRGHIIAPGWDVDTEHSRSLCREMETAMCVGCYLGYGAPKDVTPAASHAAKAIGAVFRENPTGGNLAVVIDDWNLDDENLESSAANMESVAEFVALAALQMCSVEERVVALAISDGLLTTTGEFTERMRDMTDEPNP